MIFHKERGITRKLGVLAGIGAAGTLLSGCKVAPPDNGFFWLLRFGWPQGVTPESQLMGNFWVWTWVAAWTIGAIVWALIFWSMYAYTAKKAEKRGEDFPRQTAYNVPLELVLTVIPVIIVMAMFFFTVQTQDAVTRMNKDPKVTVDVTAYQWNWKFGYGEIDGSLMANGQDYNGRVPNANNDSEVFFTREHGHGHDEAEGADHGHHAEEGKQQIDYPIHGRSKSDLSYLRFDKIETLGTTDEIPVLVVPYDTTIEFDLASADVVHSFWVPEFLFKRDAFPHPEKNKSARRFQIEKIDSELMNDREDAIGAKNAFVGRCAEMCGTYHAMMNFEIRAVSPEKFKQYIKFRQDHPSAANSDALAEIGEEPYAVSTSPFNPGRLDTRSMKPGTNSVDLNK